MEEQNRQTQPVRYPEPPGRYLWRLTSPLIVQLGISFVVSMAAGFIFGGLYIMQQYDITAEVMNNAKQMEMIWGKLMEDYGQLSRGMAEEMYKYGAFTQGLTAFFTIPVLWVMFHRDRLRDKLRGFVPNKKAALWKYGAVIVLGASLCVGINNLMIIGNISTVGDEYVTMMEGFYSAPLAVQIVSLVILVPICEELVFRGLIFKRIRETSSYRRAAFHSALIFGLMHMNLVQMFYGFFLGFVFAYLYEKYGSVKAPVLAHITANLVSVTGMYYQWFDWMLEEKLRIGVITVLCAALASTMYVLIQRIEEKPEDSEKPEILQNC